MTYLGGNFIDRDYLNYLLNKGKKIMDTLCLVKGVNAIALPANFLFVSAFC